MRAVILDAISKTESWRETTATISEELEKNGIETQIVTLAGLNILPCYGCEGCLRTTPGKCVMNDDTAEFMGPVAKSNCLIGVTDIKFGGYASLYKLVVDKFALLATPYYEMKNAKMVHRKRYKNLKAYYVLGTGEDMEVDEAENFKRLVRRNAMNMNVDRFKGFTMEQASQDYTVITKLVGRVMDDAR